MNSAALRARCGLLIDSRVVEGECLCCEGGEGLADNASVGVGWGGEM